MRRGDVVAWTSLTASCGTALALVMLAYSQHPHQAWPTPPVGPAVAFVTTYTPPTAPIEQKTDAEKRRLALLLRLPMRDPFSRADSGR
jgi:hypothetical protein